MLLHSETIGRIVHADRMRDLERTARERRLMTPEEDPLPARDLTVPTRVAPVPSRGGSAGQPARLG
jgi:hypothetical protein